MVCPLYILYPGSMQAPLFSGASLEVQSYWLDRKKDWTECNVWFLMLCVCVCSKVFFHSSLLQMLFNDTETQDFIYMLGHLVCISAAEKGWLFSLPD